MKEDDVEIIITRANEKYSNANPLMISARGSQFVSRDFKDFIRLSGMTHGMISRGAPSHITRKAMGKLKDGIELLKKNAFAQSSQRQLKKRKK